MRRAHALAAALTAASAIALIGPAAHAATTARVVGTASCTGGGTIRLATSIDEARTAKAVATVSGAKQSRWAGEVIAGVDETSDMSAESAAKATKRFVVTHGTFTTVATRTDASTADALGVFMSAGLRSTCTAMVVQARTQYGVVIPGTSEGLIIAAGPVDALDASIDAQRHHRYRATFTVTGKGAPQHLSAEKTAQRRGVLDIVVRHVKGLSAFSKVSLQVVDLTDHAAHPRTYSIAR